MKRRDRIAHLEGAIAARRNIDTDYARWEIQSLKRKLDSEEKDAELFAFFCALGGLCTIFLLAFGFL